MNGYKTFLGCLVFVVLWSSGWIGSKYGQDFAGTFTLLAYRYMIVVIALLLFVSIMGNWRRIPFSHIRMHIIVGVLSHAVYLGAGNSALDLGVSAGMVAFITAVQPMITATFSSSFTGEGASHRQWGGLALGFAAIMLVISDKVALGGSALAYSLPFFAIVAISVASLIDRRLSLQQQSLQQQAAGSSHPSASGAAEPTPLSLVCLIHCASALLVIVPMAALTENFEAQWGVELVFSVLWLAVVVSLGAYGMMFFMLRRMSAVKVASLEYLAPPTTMLIAFFMFNERLTMVDVVGILLASVAVWLVVSRPGKSASATTAGHAPIRENAGKAILQRLSAGNDASRAAAMAMPRGSALAVDIALETSTDATIAAPLLSAPATGNQSGHADSETASVDVFEFQQRQIAALKRRVEAQEQEIEQLNSICNDLAASHQTVTDLQRALKAAAREIDHRLDDTEMLSLFARLQKGVRRRAAATGLLT